MNQSEAQDIVNRHDEYGPCDCNVRPEHYEYHEAVGFLKGQQSLQSTLNNQREEIRELVEAGNRLRKYHAFIPNAEVFLKFEEVLNKHKPSPNEGRGEK